MAMKRIKLVNSLLAGGRILEPGTILEHPNPERLLEMGAAVESPEGEGEVTSLKHKGGKKKPAESEPAGE